jgi:hypothetical protein
MRIEFFGRKKLTPEPIAVTALPMRLRMNMANMALVNIVTALVMVPPAPETEAKMGTLTFVVPSLMEFGNTEIRETWENEY